MDWSVEYTDEFGEWWDTLTEQEQTDIAAAVGVLERLGPLLRAPLSKVIESSEHYPDLKELRVSSAGGERLRLFYAFDPRRTAIILIGGDKTGNWDHFYQVMVPIADDLYRAHLSELEQIEQEKKNRKQGGK